MGCPFSAPSYLAVMDRSPAVHLELKIWNVAKRRRAFKDEGRRHEYPLYHILFWGQWGWIQLEESIIQPYL